MAFTIPQFPIEVGIWHMGSAYTNPPDVTTVGNLCYPRRTEWSAYPDTNSPNSLRRAGQFTLGMSILLPALTDVRGLFQFLASDYDLLEAPLGTGRVYAVTFVDDVAKGFANEHRRAELLQLTDNVTAFIGNLYGIQWPIPTP